MNGRDPRWLNIGCGVVPAGPPWVNIDSQPQVEPDVIASVTALPYPDGSVDWIYAGHVFEHLDWPDGVHDALAECRRVLKTDGHLCIVGPDLDRAKALPGFDWQYFVVEGGRQWPGDEHRWVCSERVFLPMIRSVFPSAFAMPISEVSPGWPVYSKAPWQMAVIA